MIVEVQFSPVTDILLAVILALAVRHIRGKQQQGTPVLASADTVHHGQPVIKIWELDGDKNPVRVLQELHGGMANNCNHAAVGEAERRRDRAVDYGHGSGIQVGNPE